MKKWLYTHRFVIFFIALLFAIFGNLLVPDSFAKTTILQIKSLLVLISGVNFYQKSKKIFKYLKILVVIDVLGFILALFGLHEFIFPEILSVLNIIFFFMVVLKLFSEIRKAIHVDLNIVIGAFSGLILLGIIGFISYVILESIAPGSFKGLEGGGTDQEDLFYFSFVSLLTIGYGDITPFTPVARSITILLSLLGNFYNVIVMAIVIGKYLNHRQA